MFTTVPFQTDMRAAGVSLLENYAADALIKLQVYRARPRSIYPPTAFIDTVTESLTLTGPKMRQRTVSIDIVVMHGLFDSGEAADQRDAFLDGFLDWVLDNPHAAAATTLIGDRVTVEDIPDYLTDWMPLEEQKNYYATRITLEGFAGG